MLTFVYFLILMAIEIPVSLFTYDNETVNSLASILLTLLMLPMTYGLYVSFLGLGRGKELRIGELFAHFNKRVHLTLILQTVYTFLWTLLFIIPGIIKSFSYSMTYFVLEDYPELSYNQAIDKSIELMDGNRIKLFLLILSFIGWLLLSILTLGIGLFWCGPYMYQAMAAFYEDLKTEKSAE